ncbi:MAG: hypothetical protein HY906_23585 [Deltaproteobacteria bacterium]|nr:hypothetical protein [Deltaproteobacteria bacterium]
MADSESMVLHPEVRAYLELERSTRRTRLLVHAGALFAGLGPALVLRGLAHVGFSGVELHVAAAFELVAWALPLLLSAAVARALLNRWRSGAGLALAARIASRYGVPPSALYEALHAR